MSVHPAMMRKTEMTTKRIPGMCDGFSFLLAVALIMTVSDVYLMSIHTWR